MLVEALCIPLIIGKLRGGNLKNLLNIQVKMWWLITVAGFVEFLSSFVRMQEIGSIWRVIDENIFWIHLICYSLLIFVLILNRNQKGFVLLLIGTILNFSVIMVNGGRMPVEIGSVEHLMSAETVEALKLGKDLTHTVLNESTRLRFLADVIHLPKPYPFPKSLSIGDLFLIGGVFRLIQASMVTKATKAK
ncbi:MAG: hypothetical protein CVU84_07300 [Firmicutes bacterium HGW-Firmicutes-1]|jgi:hypothetical protein|nr:MAG: hypothetical protein CVU84_07300 [Firmicutes bacterium HGW-Firmicutes-1]